MAMSVGTADDGPMLEINTTPLIDVLLVLLIMLIITLPALTHAIRLDLPLGSGSASVEPVRVLVDFDGTILWNGHIVPTLDDLERRMRSEARRQPQPALNVSADRRAQYDAVAHVLGIAQRSGMRNIGIAGTP